jgi:hypothetical protein
MQRSIIATPCKRCSLWAEKSRRRKVRMWPTPTCALHKSGSASWGVGRVAHVIGTAVPRADLPVSLCLDVCLADGAAVFVVFRAKITSEARGTYPYWKEPLGDKLLLERLQSGGGLCRYS